MKLAIIRIRGRVGVKPDIRKTLELLKLDRKNTVAIVEDKPEIRGMINVVKDYVAWGEIDDEVAKLLEEKVPGKGKAVRYYRLAPPKGGFKKSIKKHKPYGVLGYLGKEAIEDLIKRMIESYERSKVNLWEE